jgi:hypothetical protein
MIAISCSERIIIEVRTIVLPHYALIRVWESLDLNCAYDVSLVTREDIQLGEPESMFNLENPKGC